MPKTITLITLASLAIAFGAGVAPAQAGWKLCVKQQCHHHNGKWVCKNVLFDCPSSTSGEHTSTWTSDEKGSNW